MDPRTIGNSNITYGSKQFHKSSLFLLRIVLAPKFLPKQIQNHSKTLPKRVPKTHRNSTPNFIDFASEMSPQMRPRTLKNRPPGALWGHMWPKGHKMEVRHPPRYPFPHFRHRFLILSNIIPDFLSTCKCRVNQPLRITKPIAYRLKRPWATGHLVKSTVDDHDYVRRPRATGHLVKTTTTTVDDHNHGHGPLKRLSTNECIDKTLSTNH